MVQDTTFSLAQSSPESTVRMDAWTQARKRADDYLKLHRLPGDEREQLLARVAHKLTRTSPCSDQELIQRFIRTVQEELAAQKVDTRTQTGPRFERSSIRVAPLRTITLLPQHNEH